jgi:hypothetical protein
MHLRQLRGWLVRLFGLFHRKQREREFAEELESHLAFRIEDNLRAGMSPQEARRRALIKLGGITLTQERYREHRVRNFPLQNSVTTITPAPSNLSIFTSASMDCSSLIVLLMSFSGTNFPASIIANRAS